MDKTTERIKADAEAYVTGIGDVNRKYAAKHGYIAGATAENNRAQGELKEAQDAARMFCNKHNETATQLSALVDRAQVLVEALNEFISYHESGLLPARHVYEKAVAALEQWKGTGKEVKPVKEIEYMPIHPEDARKPYCPRQFPMNLLDEQHAQRNHGQTLQKLKERGGLGVLEILSIVNKKPWSYYRDLKWDDALRMLNDILTNPTK